MTEVATSADDDCIADIIDLFVGRGVHRVPVLRQNRVVGVIGLRDVVRFVRRMKDELLKPALSGVEG